MPNPNLKIKKLPYDNRHEKPSVIKVKAYKAPDYTGLKNRQESRLLRHSVRPEGYIAPSAINETGRVWTF